MGRILPTRGSSWRGLLPPLRGGNSSSQESPALPIPSYPALCREDTTSWNNGRSRTHREQRHHQTGGSGGPGSNFLIVFKKEWQGKVRPEDPEVSGAISLLLFNIEYVRIKRPEDPEVPGAISLLLFNIDFCKEKGGRGIQRSREQKKL